MTTLTARRIEPERARHPGASRIFGLGLFVFAVGIVLNAVLGPLMTGVVRYPISESVLNETLGLEVVSLALIAPLSLAAASLSLRGHRAAALVAFGPAAYAIYIFTQYVLGPQYEVHPAILPLHIGMFTLSGAILLAAWSLARAGGAPRITPRSDRRWSWVLIAMAAFVVIRYVPAFGGIVTGEPIPGEYGVDTTFYWSMLLMDLGIVVPSTFAAAVSLRRGRGWARLALFPIVGWFALLPVSVAAMAITKVINDDPAGDVGTAVMFGIAAAVFLGIAAKLYRPLFTAATPAAIDDHI